MITEYRSMLKSAGVRPAADATELQRLKVLERLVSEGQWTKSGAQELVHVATLYGHRFLRNACALAKAMEVEDGLIKM
jgi:hypothetical protein